MAKIRPTWRKRHTSCRLVYEALMDGASPEDVANRFGYKNVEFMKQDTRRWARKNGVQSKLSLLYEPKTFCRGIRCYVLRCRFALSWYQIQSRLWGQSIENNGSMALVVARRFAENRNWPWPPPVTEAPKCVIPAVKKAPKERKPYERRERTGGTPRKPVDEVERLIGAALAAAPRHRSGRHRRVVGDVGGTEG